MSLFLTITIITILWGVGNVLIKKGYQRLSPWQTYALDAFLIAFPLWVGYGLFYGFSFAQINLSVVLMALYASLTYAWYYYTISLGEISLTSSIVATYPAATLVLAFLFLGERLSLPASLGILLTITGVIFISKPKKIKLKLEKWVIFSILNSVGYGVLSFWEKHVLANTNNATLITIVALAQIITVIVWRFFSKDKLPKLNVNNFIYSFVGIVFINVGMIFYYIALEKGLASIVVPLSNTYITITVLLSLIWLREKISLRQAIGITMTVLGVILVGLNI